MSKNILFLTALIFVILATTSCSSPSHMKTEEATVLTYDATDSHTYSRKSDAYVTHLDWTASVDFKSHIITATAQWDFVNVTHTDTLILDVFDLNIKQVTLGDGTPTEFKIGTTDHYMGAPLRIAITPESKSVRITYTTSPTASALQWLNPQQTFGKKHPFLFTQSEAILARSWVPCQDSPGIKFTYHAKVTVPVSLLPVMSATNPIQKNSTGYMNLK